MEGRLSLRPGIHFPGDASSSLAETETIDDLPQLEYHFTGWTADEIPDASPIVAVMLDGRAVSVCFCARRASFAAEAGLETAPVFRGRGLGPRVAAAWALAMRESGRTPLYSTSWTNDASLAVARKLGLIPYAAIMGPVRPVTSGGILMKHTTISQRRGWYTAFPQLYSMPDGRQAVGVPASPFSDHFHVDRRSQFLVFESRGRRGVMAGVRRPGHSVQLARPEPSRERYDRFADVMPDGSYLCAGSVGWQIWPAERRGEAEEMGLIVRPHQVDADSIVVGGHKMFVQRSIDGGRTWTRREWTIPGFGAFQVHQVPQGSRLEDGTILICCTAQAADGNPAGSFVWRSDDDGKTFRMMPMGAHAAARYTNETSFLEVAPGRILSLSRTSPDIRPERRGDPGGLVQRWSEDKGRTWTYPVEADFWGYPTHLLMLWDGRACCAPTATGRSPWACEPFSATTAARHGTWTTSSCCGTTEARHLDWHEPPRSLNHEVHFRPLHEMRTDKSNAGADGAWVTRYRPSSTTGDHPDRLLHHSWARRHNPEAAHVPFEIRLHVAGVPEGRIPVGLRRKLRVRREGSPSRARRRRSWSRKRALPWQGKCRASLRLPPGAAEGAAYRPGTRTRQSDRFCDAGYEVRASIFT